MVKKKDPSAPAKPRGRPKKERGIGDNSGVLSGEAMKQLKSLASRVTTLMGERDMVNEDIAAVFNEARDSGFDVKFMRKAIAISRADRVALEAEQDMIDLYLHAILGDLLDSLETDVAPQKSLGQQMLDADHPIEPDQPTDEEAEFAEIE